MEFVETINVKGVEYQLLATYDSAGNKIVDVYATHEDVNTVISDKIEELIGSAPEALDTLGELAKSLNDDANYAATVTQELAKKANASNVYTKSEVDLLEIKLKDDVETKYNTLSGIIVTKANSADVYTKEQLLNKAEIETYYALKSELHEIPENVSHFNNDAGYLSEIPEEYVTEEELEAKQYLVAENIAHLAVEATVNAELENKVDKVEGYSLMSDENNAKVAALPTRTQYDERMTLLDQAIEAMESDINDALLKNESQEIAIQNNANAVQNKVDKVEGYDLISDDLINKLSDLPTKEELEALLLGKVNIEEGKQLSTNDYTTEDKEKLAALSSTIEQLLQLLNTLNDNYNTLLNKVSELEEKVAALEEPEAPVE